MVLDILMKIIAIFSILLILTGCGKKYTITPDELPVAHVNQKYHQVIHISGGKVVDKDQPLNTNIPEDLGITFQPANDRDGYNIIEVKGTQNIKVHLQFMSGWVFMQAAVMKSIKPMLLQFSRIF